MTLRSRVARAALAAAAGIALALSPVMTASAADGGDFDPGLIVSDAAFYDGEAMTAEQIQSFLIAQLPLCETWHRGRAGNQPPFTCLKDYAQSVPAMPADEYCDSVSGGRMSAAEIIAEVGRACDISPKALLVLLQKEQSLVTDTWPWPRQYEHATGFSCPDSAPCDPQFAGFFYQVYYGARQFQMYRLHPESYNFRAGEVVAIAFHPDPACGAAAVTIANQATAGLYNYTPYQPNAAALQSLYSVGDDCSSYGNRNFWRIWSDWFGSPTAA